MLNHNAEHQLLRAIELAAEAHRHQRRKGNNKVPYINHPIKVATMLAKCGFTSHVLLKAAVLHDVIEDTGTGYARLANEFGEAVAKLVLEVSDDMSLSPKKRKQHQVDHAGDLSVNAGRIKIADKTCNIRDMLTYPLTWTTERKRKYVEWAQEVIKGIKQPDDCLMEEFKTIVKRAQKELY